MQGKNRSAQSSSFGRTPANTNAVAADRGKSDDPFKDYVLYLFWVPYRKVTLTIQ